MILFEGLGLCAILLIICLIGKRKGAVGLVHLYEKDVQEKTIELGLTSPERIKKNAILMKLSMLILFFPYLLICVYWINGARGFGQGFWQMTIIILIMTVFDRVFIDFFWVDHTKAWIIPGTEELRPYVPVREHIKRWILMVVLYPPVLAAVLSGIMTLFLRPQTIL